MVASGMTTVQQAGTCLGRHDGPATGTTGHGRLVAAEIQTAQRHGAAMAGHTLLLHQFGHAVVPGNFLLDGWSRYFLCLPGALLSSAGLFYPSVTDRVFARMREMRQRERAHAFADLSAQEMQILTRVAEGETNREIGAALQLCEKAVRNYVSIILGKLGLASQAQAAAYAARNRIEDYL
jgi:DNA-binding CsgD family transcriptional regulator